MRHEVHPNSLAAYHGSGPALSRRAQTVLDWLRAHGPATDRQAARGLGFGDMNAVRPRITELVDLGLLRETGSRRCEVTGKTVRVVDVPRGPAQGDLFS